MQLYKLGKIPWQESQLIYHALAHLGREALSLVSPATPYVCIGFHQDVEQEVDLDYCRAHDIPVFRRDLGGGAVYLDGNQLFYQVILRRDNPLVTQNKLAFYRTFLEPVVRTYRKIGIPALYKPVNDVIAGTRKISGTGVAEIGGCVVFVGNLILDFDYDMMARVLKVPDEKFRDKVHKTLTDNLSTIRRELSDQEAARWDEGGLNDLIAEEFGVLLGPMAAADKDPELQAKMDELAKRMLSDEWLFRKGKPGVGRDIKIRAGVQVQHRMHKAPGGLIRADLEIVEDRIGGVSISGDFFCYPGDAVARLEAALEGVSLSDAADVLGQFYAGGDVETPGIGIEDWLKVFGV
ncbi:MAG: lipoate--protein ligase family protein [Deltaproteobacteria bacterium]|nr:lipoate--protein ligase family protein [Deltaproteobacteria bacterium]